MTPGDLHGVLAMARNGDWVTVLAWFAAAVADQKTVFERASLINADGLHAMIGALLFVMFAAILRRRLSSAWPWLLVLLVELANEANDILHVGGAYPSIQLGESLKDICTTMSVPTLLVICTRLFPSLLVRNQPREETDISE